LDPFIILKQSFYSFIFQQYIYLKKGFIIKNNLSKSNQKLRDVDIITSKLNTYGKYFNKL